MTARSTEQDSPRPQALILGRIVGRECVVPCDRTEFKRTGTFKIISHTSANIQNKLKAVTIRK
jgi:hypothetical protein